MMTDEELDALQKLATKWGNSDEEETVAMGVLIAVTLRHIDEQAKYIKELEEHADDHATKYKTDMDDWRSQIATLKAALIDDRSELILCGPSYSLWRYQNNIDRIESQDGWKPIEAKAKEELAKEYPDIFKEE